VVGAPDSQARLRPLLGRALMQAEPGAHPGGEFADGFVGFGGNAGQKMEDVLHFGVDFQFHLSVGRRSASARLRLSSSRVS
jgi:hypothetical protein